MNDTEFLLQAKVRQAFEELNKEVKRISPQVSGLGFMLRGAHRAYIYSDFQTPEKLESARMAFIKAHSELELLKWLIQLLDTHNGSNGYFASYNQFIKEIDNGIEMAIKLNSIDKADFLSYWRGKLPIPEDLESKIYTFLPIGTDIKSTQDYFNEFKKRFENLSDEEIVDAFNSQVNGGGSGSAPMGYRAALHHEFIHRGYEYSVISDSDGLSFKNKVKLENNQIITIQPNKIDEAGN